MPGVTQAVEMYYRSVVDGLDQGARLPSERQVVARLGTCRSTVRIVLTKLVSEKLVFPIQGRGYFRT